VRIEPFMNGFLLAALALYLWRPQSKRTYAVIGALFAMAVLSKFAAVLPIGFLVLADWLWRRRNLDFLTSWCVAALGAAVVAGVVVAVQGGMQGFIESTVEVHLDRPSMTLARRLEQFGSAMVRYPVLPLALLISGHMILYNRDWRLRALALVCLGPAAWLVFAFASSLNFYFVQLLPAAAVVFTVACYTAARQFLGGCWKPAFVIATVALAVLAPLLYAEIYQRYGKLHTSSPAEVVDRLRLGEGYVYSSYPSFALASGRELYPWHYAPDSHLPRLAGIITDEDIAQTLSGTNDVVLVRNELRDRPVLKAHLESAGFSITYNDVYWELWSRDSAR
jgi:hypothetical protein